MIHSSPARTAASVIVVGRILPKSSGTLGFPPLDFLQPFVQFANKHRSNAELDGNDLGVRAEIGIGSENPPLPTDGNAADQKINS